MGRKYVIMNSNSYFNSANMNYIFNVEYFENAKDSMINKPRLFTDQP